MTTQKRITKVYTALSSSPDILQRRHSGRLTRSCQELQECMTKPPAGMTVALASEKDLHKWHVTLAGPPQTAYEGGQYGIVVVLPQNYPFVAPTVSFATRISHPNVTNDNLGNICLGALKPENWKPASRLIGVLESVRNLLVEPQPDDPLEVRIAEEYKSNKKEFEKQAKYYANKYAKGPVSFTVGAVGS